MKFRNVPNALTVFRLVLVPTFLVTTALPGNWSSWVAVYILILAGLTDYLDGALARKLDSLSEFGKMLDPIADKLMITAVILVLVWKGNVPLLPALIIIGRELVVSGLREYLAVVGKSLEVTLMAKWKTTLQFIALVTLLAADALNFSNEQDFGLGFVGAGLFWLAALVTLITGCQYWVETRSFMAKRRSKGTS